MTIKCIFNISAPRQRSGSAGVRWRERERGHFERFQSSGDTLTFAFCCFEPTACKSASGAACPVVVFIRRFAASLAPLSFPMCWKQLHFRRPVARTSARRSLLRRSGGNEIGRRNDHPIKVVAAATHSAGICPWPTILGKMLASGCYSSVKLNLSRSRARRYDGPIS